jgi:hypothetical protein
MGWVGRWSRGLSPPAHILHPAGVGMRLIPSSRRRWKARSHPIPRPGGTTDMRRGRQPPDTAYTHPASRPGGATQGPSPLPGLMKNGLDGTGSGGCHPRQMSRTPPGCAEGRLNEVYLPIPRPGGTTDMRRGRKPPDNASPTNLPPRRGDAWSDAPPGRGTGYGLGLFPGRARRLSRPRAPEVTVTRAGEAGGARRDQVCSGIIVGVCV